MSNTKKVGRWGEEVARMYLAEQGYAIVTNNWHMGHLETDIIAMKGGRIVFCEVKTRTDTDDDPIDAIDRRKMRHMINSAIAYCDFNNERHEMQFDIITVTGTPEHYSIDHFADAFVPPLKTYR